MAAEEIRARHAHAGTVNNSCDPEQEMTADSRILVCQVAKFDND